MTQLFSSTYTQDPSSSMSLGQVPDGDGGWVVVNPESVFVVVINPDAEVACGGSAHPEHRANSMSLVDKITRVDLSAANSIPKLTVAVCSSNTAMESESKSFENVSRKSVKSMRLPSTSSH